MPLIMWYFGAHQSVKTSVVPFVGLVSIQRSRIRHSEKALTDPT